jgi:cytochrome o ubiquinol oxidase subunit 3
MNISVTSIPAVRVHHHEHDSAHDDGSRTVLGFWIYLMSDCLIFACLFAAFGVLAENTAGGPGGRELFDLPYVAGETLLLLISSFTFGMAVLNMHAKRKHNVIAWLAITFLFGAGFIAMELREFGHLISEGAGPSRSAFLSAYFTLVGTHGLHVTVGLLWLAVTMHQTMSFGLDDVVRRRVAWCRLWCDRLEVSRVGVFSWI